MPVSHHISKKISCKDHSEKFNRELIPIVKENPWIYNNEILHFSVKEKEFMWAEIDALLTKKNIDIKSKFLFFVLHFESLLYIHIICLSNVLHT